MVIYLFSGRCPGEGEEGGDPVRGHRGRLHPLLDALLHPLHGRGLLRRGQQRALYNRHLVRLLQLGAQPHPLSALQRQLQEGLQAHARDGRAHQSSQFR